MDTLIFSTTTDKSTQKYIDDFILAKGILTKLGATEIHRCRGKWLGKEEKAIWAELPEEQLEPAMDMLITLFKQDCVLHIDLDGYGSLYNGKGYECIGTVIECDFDSTDCCTQIANKTFTFDF